MKSKHEIIIGNANNMHQLKNEIVDMVITSPPYPMIEMWDDLFISLNPKIGVELEKGKGKNAFNLMNIELNKVWTEVDRVMKPGGFVCINIGDATRTVGNEFRVYSNHSEIIKCFESMGYDVLPLIIWRKQTNKPNKFMGSGMLSGGAYVTLEHEYILIFRKLPKRQFSDTDKDLRRRSSFFWEERNSWFSDIWFNLKGVGQILKTKKSRNRSAAYPFELPFRLINMYSLQGDLILDPFLGTGTTTKAAMITGRNSVGYEIDADLVNSNDGIHLNFTNIKKTSVEIVKSRLQSHDEFVKNRLEIGKEIKHKSLFYDFPVITAQEKALKFPVISEVVQKKNLYELTHRFRTSFDETDDVSLLDWF